MRGVFSVGLSRLRRTVFVAAAVLLGSISIADAASINVRWTAPTTNADGTPLRDLAEYRLYLGTATPTCPGGSAHTVPAPSAAPPSGQTVSRRVAGLTASTTYVARVTAIDSSGNESTCSPAASGVARADVSVSPTTAVNFGSVAAGATGTAPSRCRTRAPPR
jgi:hypothetical protein